MPIPQYITPELVIIFITFVLVVYVLYKLFKVMFQAAIITVAAFSFPWIVKIFGLQFPIEANVQTGIYFALAGLSLFFIYQFFHFIIYIFKIITWPLRFLFRHNEKKQIKEL